MFRLRSLSRDASKKHNNLSGLLCHHLLPQIRGQERSPNPNYQAFDIIARDLLMAGHNVTKINNCYFMTNPQKRDVAFQIIQWCCDHQWGLLDTGNDLIKDAERLNKPELAFQILGKIIGLPNDQRPVIKAKISAFTHYASTDERVKEPIQKFAQELYAQHWTGLDIYSKKAVLILSLESEMFCNKTFKCILTEMLDDPLGSFLDAWHENILLVEGLFKHGFEEEGKSIIKHALAHRFRPERCMPLLGLKSLIDWVIKIDQEDLTFQLKDKLKADLALPNDDTFKLELLIGLADIEKEETEKENLIHQAMTLLNKLKSIKSTL